MTMLGKKGKKYDTNLAGKNTQLSKYMNWEGFFYWFLITEQQPST